MFCLTSVNDFVFVHLRLPRLATPIVQSPLSVMFGSWLKPSLTVMLLACSTIRMVRTAKRSREHMLVTTSLRQCHK